MNEEKEKVVMPWFTKKTGYGLEVLYGAVFLISLSITLAAEKFV
jgi:hypothetical protein